MKNLQNSEIEAFKNQFGGEVILPTNPAFEEVRQIWNAMIDRKPSIIARCTCADDVVLAVNLARVPQLLLSVRGGGHYIAGNAVCDEGLMIDLSLLNQVEVDPISVWRESVRAAPWLMWTGRPRRMG
ncbi:FAD-binding oxidoreductase [Vibrio ostreae]|uniref:FAD-binding oxidoreductase n=1 Tax=Vibrio ostreae TaxID=2841925 RepID=UPI002113E707